MHRDQNAYATPLKRVSGVARFGSKNAALGELHRRLGAQGVRVAPGFASSTDAYRCFVQANGLEPPIRSALAGWEAGAATLAETGAKIRGMFLAAAWPKELSAAISAGYAALCAEIGVTDAAVAVRSSAAAADLPDASFAGQQDSYLNVRGAEALLDACRRCYASLFTDRAIAYRQARGFGRMDVALSVGVQQLVRADRGSSGVIFSLDIETGFDRVVLIDAAWGLGEAPVQGHLDPDEYLVFKPLLDRPGAVPIIERKRGAKTVKMILADQAVAGTRIVETSAAERSASVLADAEILQLARWARAIERHYRLPMEIEWAKDGETGALYVVQARPETVRSRRGAHSQKTCRVDKPGRLLSQGLAVGAGAASGTLRLVRDPHAVDKFPQGAVLVTETTDPEWLPIMRKAAAIITDHGGRTSHAATASRELGVPAVVGTGDATRRLRSGRSVTVSCADGGLGHVYEGRAPIICDEMSLQRLPSTYTRVLFNLASPAAAFHCWRLPADGIGLARADLVAGETVGVHPLALLHPQRVRSAAVRLQIDERTRSYADKAEYFVDHLASGLARIAAVFHPQPTIVRLSPLGASGYADLLGSSDFEPRAGQRAPGSPGLPESCEVFALECRALKRLRETLGFDTVVAMLPPCTTAAQAGQLVALMARCGLRRGEAGLKLYLMCALASGQAAVDKLAEHFDGLVLASGMPTQSTPGAARADGPPAVCFDEHSPVAQSLIRGLIERAHAAGLPVGFCSETPSAQPSFAQFLVRAGIDWISIDPAHFLAVKCNIAATEAHARRDRRRAS